MGAASLPSARPLPRVLSVSGTGGIPASALPFLARLPLRLGRVSGSPSDENVKKLRKPKPWKHSQPLTRTQLKQMRDEFWDTEPHYGGQKEIWDALRAAAEAADLTLAQAIVDSAGIIVSNADMTTCYDERGNYIN
ncbi:hypothetical protein Taro_045101 [Colocasia esculenta]|uniref:DC-UbP/UBTD2 N-terminal domain-containing protein n=1 Tax=Colocasia esculenta TaxID=4460 RepID=A0A843WVR0_COLES|nr:hypothetical protein [Colocasia esculenta]